MARSPAHSPLYDLFAHKIEGLLLWHHVLPSLGKYLAARADFNFLKYQGPGRWRACPVGEGMGIWGGDNGWDAVPPSPGEDPISL